MGDKTSTTRQTNDPPEWAKPLLEKGAAEGMKLYDSDVGYHPYTGPTQAQFSPQTLGGMNALMAATGGGGGAPITNESVFNTPAIQQARQAIADLNAKRDAQKTAAAKAPPANAGMWVAQPNATSSFGGDGWSQQANSWVNTGTGETSSTPPQAWLDQNRKAFADSLKPPTVDQLNYGLRSGGRLW